MLQQYAYIPVSTAFSLKNRICSSNSIIRVCASSCPATNECPNPDPESKLHRGQPVLTVALPLLGRIEGSVSPTSAVGMDIVRVWGVGFAAEVLLVVVVVVAVRLIVGFRW